MIITRLSLGLGNNLFQYAVGRRLALDRSTELYLDFSGENENRRRYALGYLSNFNMIQGVAPLRKAFKIKLLNKLSFLSSDHKNYVIEDWGWAFNSKVLDAPANCYLKGYWQSEKYFKPIGNILRKDLTFKKPQGHEYQNILDKITRSNSVSVHVRRGDYLLEKNLRLFITCTPAYYLNAESLISNKITQPELFVFSDDIEWVKHNIPFRSPVNFVSNGDLADYQELILLSKCKHNIIANSTYGWWGAWLNDNPEKIVITPAKWFSDPATSEEDLLPEEWIKI